METIQDNVPSKMVNGISQEAVELFFSLISPDLFVQFLRKKDISSQFKAEELIPLFKAEEVIPQFKAEEVIPQFNIEDRLKGLDIETIEKYLKKIKKQKKNNYNK